MQVDIFQILGRSRRWILSTTSAPFLRLLCFGHCLTSLIPLHSLCFLLYPYWGFLSSNFTYCNKCIITKRWRYISSPKKVDKISFLVVLSLVSILRFVIKHSFGRYSSSFNFTCPLNNLSSWNIILDSSILDPYLHFYASFLKANKHSYLLFFR